MALRISSRAWRLTTYGIVGAGAAFLLASVILTSYINTISPDGILIHHSAVPPIPGKEIDAELLDGIFRNRGYNDFYWGQIYHIAYHYVITPDGAVLKTRPEHLRAPEPAQHNSYIGICLIGNFSSADNPDGTRGLTSPTNAQMNSLVALTHALQARYRIPTTRVKLHGEVAHTACPGDRFPASNFRARLQ
ncbi:MAG TPA: peptidoglycan recognition family protein [Clostridia bacterium]|nr:peptidoglycan recognition family protein [Clostridia bacterium]